MAQPHPALVADHASPSVSLDSPPHMNPWKRRILLYLPHFPHWRPATFLAAVSASFYMEAQSWPLFRLSSGAASGSILDVRLLSREEQGAS